MLIRTFFILTLFFSAHAFMGQQTSPELEVTGGTVSGKHGLIEILSVITNTRTGAFSGKLHIAVPHGFRSISGNALDVNIPAGEKRYFTIKMVLASDTPAGTHDILFVLKEAQSEVSLAQSVFTHVVEENNSLRIFAARELLYITNDTDSVEVAAKVTNFGNLRQDVNVVFKIPDGRGGSLFTEKHASLGVRKDTVLSVKFLPAEIRRTPQINVQITAFREADREIFGNTAVVVQNVAPAQRYTSLQSQNSHAVTNGLTASFRRVGDDANMYQLSGAGGVNLPDGYITARGNIFIVSNQKDPTVNNTFLSYHRENSVLTLGNISRLMEVSLFGRGAEYTFTSSDKRKKGEAGFVDQSFSLTDRDPFLRNGYGFFLRGTTGADNASRNLSATYIFRNDPYEKVQHHLAGSDFNHAFNDRWKVFSRAFVGYSDLGDSQPSKASFSVESQYSGIVKDVSISGNYLYSSDYYPGNKKGMTQIQQSVSKSIGTKNSVYANFLYSDFSPKFYVFDYSLKTGNTRLDAGMNFGGNQSWSFGFGYQYQEDISNTYNTYLGQPYSTANSSVRAHRLTEFTRWTDADRRHSAVFSIESGLGWYPQSGHGKFQLKATGNYSFKDLNINSIYQKGSWFLSEYAFSRLYVHDTDYTKWVFSVFYNKNLLKDALNLSSGISYNDDVVYGKSPSAFLNTRWTGKKISVFLNSSWFNYAASSTGRKNLFTFELGVSLNMAGAALSPAKKSLLQATVFYDHNQNGLFDEGDTAAENFMVRINDTTFRTNAQGSLEYRNIPFDRYHIRQVIQQGWYYEDREIEITGHRTAVQIPLYRNGTVSGKITYGYDSRTAVDFDPRLGGIMLSIFKGEQLIQKVYTNDDGEFVAFLATGRYRVVLAEASLPAGTFVEYNSQTVEIKAGETRVADTFTISVRQKKTNVKKFGNAP